MTVVESVQTTTPSGGGGGGGGGGSDLKLGQVGRYNRALVNKPNESAKRHKNKFFSQYFFFISNLNSCSVLKLQTIKHKNWYM